MKRTYLLILSTWLLGAGVVQARAQSLADAARQERERQKTVHSAIVISNETLKKEGITAETTAETSGTATTPSKTEAAKKDEGPTDNEGHNEKYWREKFAAARQDLKRAQDAATLLQLQLNNLNTEFLRQGDMYNKENRLGPQITDTQKQLDDAQKQVKASEQKISDLEDDLRKAGGPPGWAR